MSSTIELSGATGVRPFHIDIPEEQIAELRRCLAARRWPPCRVPELGNAL